VDADVVSNVALLWREPMDTLLDDLDAFYLEHRRCGKLISKSRFTRRMYREGPG